jgi:hypothetical protein
MAGSTPKTTMAVVTSDFGSASSLLAGVNDFIHEVTQIGK